MEYIENNVVYDLKIILSYIKRFVTLKKISPLRAVTVIFLVSFIVGLSILFSFKTIAIKQVTITNGIINEFYIYENVLDFDKTEFVYIALFALLISNKLFLIVLVIVNILLYVELRKIMDKRMTLIRG